MKSRSLIANTQANTSQSSLGTRAIDRFIFSKIADCTLRSCTRKSPLPRVPSVTVCNSCYINGSDSAGRDLWQVQIECLSPGFVASYFQHSHRFVDVRKEHHDRESFAPFGSYMV